MKLSKLQLQILLITLSCFLFSCKKEKLSIAKTEKSTEYLLESHYDSPFFEEITFQIKQDSSYIFSKESEIDRDNSSLISKGKVLIQNDTIFFKNHQFQINQAEKAILKNNLIIFLNAENPYRIPISKTKLIVKNYYDLNQFKNYSTFTSEEFFLKHYYKRNFINYELQNNDMFQLDKIIKKMLHENNDKLRPFEEYVFQCCAVKNDKEEIEVFININCGDETTDGSFKISRFSMRDGGNCNVNLKINLTKNTYSDLSIAGSV
ncbi:hypothetical protein NU10_11020 [Flavobacterium dauae]|uniref:hypothetical protein n=1 Tax=Flavobacterium dauae TaxID=1563479 RepID=UPI00101B33CE|nr:hypothetical protein [Flavobacterium dauae]WLD23234.1 hypothetical protein NU10_11020 [Flavobacterium dauae]